MTSSRKPYPWEKPEIPGIPFASLSPEAQEAIRRRTEDVLKELRAARPKNETLAVKRPPGGRW